MRKSAPSVILFRSNSCGIAVFASCVGFVDVEVDVFPSCPAVTGFLSDDGNGEWAYSHRYSVTAFLYGFAIGNEIKVDAFVPGCKCTIDASAKCDACCGNEYMALVIVAERLNVDAPLVDEWCVFEIETEPEFIIVVIVLMKLMQIIINILK